MSSMGDNTKSADVSISVESVDDQSSSIPPPKIATTASEPPLSKKSRIEIGMGVGWQDGESLEKDMTIGVEDGIFGGGRKAGMAGLDGASKGSRSGYGWVAGMGSGMGMKGSLGRGIGSG
ncbi:hypothetical protein ACH5RR_036825 [Cinchona calisaya]|uniref:Uncharacterized protein n=1 Tax=Cinchona calisaya TaxID=153742 RepID=A0ABD2Y6N1_9GENT